MELVIITTFCMGLIFGGIATAAATGHLGGRA